MSNPFILRRFLGVLGDKRAGFIAAALAAVALIAFAFIFMANPAKLPGHRSAAVQATPSLQLPTGNHVSAKRNPPADSARVNASYAALPVAFEPNVGQTDAQVKYLARGQGYSLFLSSTAAYFAVPDSAQPSPRKRYAPQVTAADAMRRREPREPARTASIEMEILGSNAAPQIIAENKLPGVTNYILGRDPSKWHSGVPHYAQVRYRDVYPGVDIAYHGASRGDNKFEFDFLINPGADAGSVALGFHGLKQVRTTPAGDLLLTSSGGGELHLHRPFAYQEKEGVRQRVEAGFVIHAKDHVSFALGNYDHSRQVVIDPTVTYSTYLGGSMEDDGNAITADASGNAYITGQTDSTNFPGVAGTVTTLGTGGDFDVFVTELNASGALVFTTIVGGSQDDIGNAIAVDTASTPPGIYVAGQTTSSGSSAFPTTSGVVQPAYIGGANVGFLFKLSLNGSSLIWSTLIEGSIGDSALGLALVRDATTTTDDDVYVVGSTESPDFGSNSGTNGTVHPLPQGNSLNNGAGANGSVDGFIAKVQNGGTAYLFLTYLGGSSDDIAYGVAADSVGNIYVGGGTSSVDFYTTPSNVVQPTCGTDGKCNASGGSPNEDAFLAAITSGNSPSYIYSTFLGGESVDYALAIAVDSSKNAYITGQTTSTKFPTKNPLTGLSSLAGTQDVFVASVNPTGTALNYSTYLGGTGLQSGTGVAVDGSGDAYVTGYTSASNFPTAAATQSTFGGGNGATLDTDAFVSELTLNGTALSLPFSTYLGGSGNEDFISGALAVDASGNIYVTGETNSPNFPLSHAVDGHYNDNDPSQTCLLSGGGSSIPCPDAFVTVYAFITGTPLAAVNPGGSSTSTITVSPFDDSGSSVNLTCSVSGGGTPAPTCAFSSASVSGGSGTSTLTVSTTAASSQLVMPGSRRGTIFLASSLLLPVAGFVLIGVVVPFSATRKNRWAAWLCVCLLLSGILILPACGGSSSGSGGGGGAEGGAEEVAVGVEEAAAAPERPPEPTPSRSRERMAPLHIPSHPR